MNESGTNQNMPKQCPQCGAALPSGALEGLCPACLLRQGPDTGPAPGSVPFQPPTLEEVAKLFPQLEILGFIGKGGMGAVYKARQPALDRLVALKILPPQAAGGAGFAERFNREARALAKLNHPNIVAVHEFGQAGGSPFFIMEFVDGLTLRQLEQAGRLSPGEALRIVPQICEALQFAHDAGIVHRDIKPENILIDKKGRVKIADFGIAKIIGGQEGGSGMTGSRQAMGTPHYMAPEQVEQPQTVDHRADIFSLGVVFYEMLTGQLPLGRFAPPSRKVEIDARLDEVVLRALEREPELRYQQAGEVKTEIDTIASTPPGASLSGEHARPRASQPAPSPTGSPHPHGQVFAWLALGFFIAALLGWPLLMAIDPTHGAALVSTALCLLLALVFGLISWHERIGRVVAIVIMGLGAVVGLAAVVMLLRHQTSLFTDVLKDRDSTIQRPEPRNTKLDRVAPGDSKSVVAASAAGKNSAGFVEYTVNKTWAELGDVFDLSTPEKAVASVSIGATSGTDFATLLNKATVGLPKLPEGSLHLTISAEDAADRLKSTVVEVILYHDDLAGVVTFKPNTNQFITACLERQNGEWKLYVGDYGLDFTLTKEAAVRQFKKEAENYRRKIQALATQPQADLASTIPQADLAAKVGALSNGIVQIGGAFGQAMQQLESGLIGSQASGMSNVLAQMGGGLGKAMQQIQNGVQGSPNTGLPGGMMQMGDAIQGIQKNMIDMQIQMIKNGGGGSGGSFSIGNPLGGPPMSIQWSRSGTNLTITTNQ
jgi:predicted Ser/Thr protein kinase